MPGPSDSFLPAAAAFLIGDFTATGTGHDPLAKVQVSYCNMPLSADLFARPTPDVRLLFNLLFWP